MKNDEALIWKNNKLTKMTKCDKLIKTFRAYLHRFKIVDTWKCRITPHSDSKYYFKLSPKEFEDAEKLYKEKGTISYEFYPCGGIAWGVRVHVLKTKEIIDISDVSNW